MDTSQEKSPSEINTDCLNMQEIQKLRSKKKLFASASNPPAFRRSIITRAVSKAVTSTPMPSHLKKKTFADSIALVSPIDNVDSYSNRPPKYLERAMNKSPVELSFDNIKDSQLEADLCLKKTRESSVKNKVENRSLKDDNQFKNVLSEQKSIEQKDVSTKDGRTPPKRNQQMNRKSPNDTTKNDGFNDLERTPVQTLTRRESLTSSTALSRKSAVTSRNARSSNLNNIMERLTDRATSKKKSATTSNNSSAKDGRKKMARSLFNNSIPNQLNAAATNDSSSSLSNASDLLARLNTFPDEQREYFMPDGGPWRVNYEAASLNDEQSLCHVDQFEDTFRPKVKKVFSNKPTKIHPAETSPNRESISPTELGFRFTSNKAKRKEVLPALPPNLEDSIKWNSHVQMCINYDTKLKTPNKNKCLETRNFKECYVSIFSKSGNSSIELSQLPDKLPSHNSSKKISNENSIDIGIPKMSARRRDNDVNNSFTESASHCEASTSANTDHQFQPSIMIADIHSENPINIDCAQGTSGGNEQLTELGDKLKKSKKGKKKEVAKTASSRKKSIVIENSGAPDLSENIPTLRRSTRERKVALPKHVTYFPVTSERIVKKYTLECKFLNPEEPSTFVRRRKSFINNTSEVNNGKSTARKKMKFTQPTISDLPSIPNNLECKFLSPEKPSTFVRRGKSSIHNTEKSTAKKIKLTLPPISESQSVSSTLSSKSNRLKTVPEIISYSEVKLTDNLESPVSMDDFGFNNIADYSCIEGEPADQTVINIHKDGKLYPIKWVCVRPIFQSLKESSGIDMSLLLSNSVEGSSLGSLKIPIGGQKPKLLTQKHSIYFIIAEGQAKIGVHDKIICISKGASFTVPKGHSYYIKNVSETEDLCLHFMRLQP